MSVSGSLIRNQPLAGVCYTGEDWAYDAESCDHVTSNWNDATLQAESPIGYQYPGDLPCPPSLNETYGRCSLGDSPVYTINATRHTHISEGIKFARDKNLRLVIRNTGHDMLGRYGRDSLIEASSFVHMTRPFPLSRISFHSNTQIPQIYRLR